MAQLEKAIAKDAYGVYYAKESLWNSFGIQSEQTLEFLAKNKKLSTDIAFKSFRESIKVTQ